MTKRNDEILKKGSPMHLRLPKRKKQGENGRQKPVMLGLSMGLLALHLLTGETHKYLSQSGFSERAKRIL